MTVGKQSRLNQTSVSQLIRLCLSVGPWVHNAFLNKAVYTPASVPYGWGARNRKNVT